MQAPTPTIPAAAITVVPVPSRKTVMHRVIEGPDHNIWFTELGTNTVGRITIDG